LVVVRWEVDGLKEDRLFELIFLIEVGDVDGSVSKIECEVEVQEGLGEIVGGWGILDKYLILHHGTIFNHYIFEKVQMIINPAST
jgi:hypothetical protein